MSTLAKGGLTAMAAALIASGASAEAPATPCPTVKIGMIDTMIQQLPLKDRNVKVFSRDMTEGHAARWEGESGYSHGELVAASAIHAARARSPESPIEVYAANVYSPSEEDATQRALGRGSRGDPDASKVHLTLNWQAASKAIDWMKGAGVSVVIVTATGSDTPGMRAMADKVRQAGMVMVASTNNVPVSGKVFPAAYPDVISVAGDDRSLPVWNSAALASYVSYVAPSRVPLRSGPEEVGSSFAAGAIGGALASYASTREALSPDDGRRWLDATSVPASCSGVTVRMALRKDPEPEGIAAPSQASAAVDPAARRLQMARAMAAGGFQR